MKVLLKGSAILAVLEAARTSPTQVDQDLELKAGFTISLIYPEKKISTPALNAVEKSLNTKGTAIQMFHQNQVETKLVNVAALWESFYKRPGYSFETLQEDTKIPMAALKRLFMWREVSPHLAALMAEYLKVKVEAIATSYQDLFEGVKDQTTPDPEPRQTALPWSERKDLPNRRKGYNQKLTIVAPEDDLKIYLRTGEYPDGTLGEIFIDISSKEESLLKAMVNLFAIAVSTGLQYGVPLERYVQQFVFTNFEPKGMVRDHDNIKICNSVADLIFRDLAIKYLNRTDLAHIKSSEQEESL